jgi:hypothetical protein
VAFYNRQRPNGYCQDLTPDRGASGTLTPTRHLNNRVMYPGFAGASRHAGADQTLEFSDAASVGSQVSYPLA